MTTDVLNGVGEAGAGVALLSMLGSGSSLPSALRVVLLSEMCDPFKHSKAGYDNMMMNPLGLVVWNSPAAGMLLGNALLCTGVAASMFMVVFVVKTAFRAAPCGGPLEKRRFQPVHAFDSMVSAALCATRVLYPGLALGGFEGVFCEDEWGAAIVGAAGTCFVVALPIILYRIIRGFAGSNAFYLRDPRTERQMCANWLAGPGEWVSTCRRCRVADRYASLLRCYRPATAWFASVELGCVAALSAVNVLQHRAGLTFIQCGHIKAAAGGVMAVLTGAVLYTRPGIRPHDNSLTAAAAICQVLAMVAMAGGYYGEDPSSQAFAASAALIFASVVLLGIKAVLEVTSEAWVFLNERRHRLQEATFEALEIHHDRPWPSPQDLHRWVRASAPSAQVEPEEEPRPPPSPLALQRSLSSDQTPAQPVTPHGSTADLYLDARAPQEVKGLSSRRIPRKDYNHWRQGSLNRSVAYFRRSRLALSPVTIDEEALPCPRPPRVQHARSHPPLEPPPSDISRPSAKHLRSVFISTFAEGEATEINCPDRVRPKPRRTRGYAMLPSTASDLLRALRTMPPRRVPTPPPAMRTTTWSSSSSLPP